MHGITEIDAAELQALLAAGEKLRLIDVRTSAEFNQGIIAGGEFLPLHTLPLRMNELVEGEKIVFYCRSGSRSAQACMFLKQNTGVEAINLRGGIANWYHSGFKITAPTVAA